MLTLDVLYAVLQGLHPSHFSHLDGVWQVFCGDIYQAIKQGRDPVTAFKNTLDQARYGILSGIEQALSELLSVSDLPGLTFRQKQALSTLRHAKVLSLTQLSRTLLADPSNTQKRLNVLIKKGLVGKFFRQGGIFYYAIASPLDRSTRSSIYKIIGQRLEKFRAKNGQAPTRSTKATKSLEPTTPTT